ncbi:MULTISPECIES: hypothetical protein [Gordonia]|uniref:TIGR04076 family protein n=1 Tax=Gordonia rubripertincta TaxID=36822 RepID=A0AAW4G2I4_GORRU|nr:MULTISPECIES: hypothetical protein [Gordonia]MBM7277464.1 hypothetical protein [Gordonia rubripertincta]MCK8615956.1 hypothetical protein [Gordonia sp. C13]
MSTDSGSPAMVGPTPRVRVQIDRADAPRCGARVGDYVVIDETGMSTNGKPFCPNALAAVLPCLGTRQMPLPADDWLLRKPYFLCPHVEENVVITLMPEMEGSGTTGAAS